MKSLTATTTSKEVRHRIETGGERFWRFVDFQGMPFTAVAQTLSRLTKEGAIQRLGKGLYFRPRQTTFGLSKPNQTKIRMLPIHQCGVFPAGIAAANMLGFTTQNVARIELATNGMSLPRLIVGRDTIIHTRRPESWRELSPEDAAILDFMRNRGRSSELSDDDTAQKLVEHFRSKGRFNRLLKIADSEPPRVRAMLGAIGEELGRPQSQLAALRESLNPLSRFDFGGLNALPHASNWQAKEQKRHETV